MVPVLVDVPGPVNSKSVDIGPYRFVRVVDIPAGALIFARIITADFMGPEFELKVGMRLNALGPAAMNLRLRANVDVQISLLWSENFELIQDAINNPAGGGSMNVTVVNEPLEVEGPVPVGAPAPLALFGNPVTVGMLQNLGGGIFLTTPLQTISGQGLLTEKFNVAFGFNFAVGDIVDVRTARCAAVGIAAGGANALTIASGGTLPLAVFKPDRTFVGYNIPSPPTEAYYLVPLVGTQTIQFQSAAADWAVGLALSPDAHL